VQGQYDAAIIGCAGDPGLAPARELAEIPIIAPFESSISVASMLGDKFSIITILDSIVPAIRRTLRDYGVEHKCASVRVINFNVLDMIGNREKVARAFLKEAKSVAEKDGASSIILGCMTMAFLLVDEAVNGRIEIPIINPAKISIKVAEMLVSLGLKQSRASYPRPNIEKLRNSLFPGMTTAPVSKLGRSK
jgi:allantoin racemase